MKLKRLLSVWSGNKNNIHKAVSICVEGLIEMKQELGREKDLKDIALIKAFKMQKSY